MAADPNKVILTGREPTFIRLSSTGAMSRSPPMPVSGGSSPAPPGRATCSTSRARLTESQLVHLIVLPIAMARWLQQTVQGMLNPETADTSIAVRDAVFSKTGDPRYFWTETAVTDDGEVSLTWYDHRRKPPCSSTPIRAKAGRQYGVCTLLVPAARPA